MSVEFFIVYYMLTGAQVVVVILVWEVGRWLWRQLGK